MSDRHHLERLLRALAGPESELVAAIEAATAHIAQTPDPLDAVEVKDSTMGEWLDSGGERRRAPRD